MFDEGWTDRWSVGKICRQMERWKDVRTDGVMERYADIGEMDGFVDRWSGGKMCGQMEWWNYVWRDGVREEYVDRWSDGRI